MRGVCYRHHAKTPLVMDHVDLSVERGSRACVLGANGAGKTTLFYSLTGVYKPTEGEVLFDGEPIEYSKEGLTKVRSKVAVVLQNPDEQMFSSTVEEDVAFGPLNNGVARDEIDARIDRALRDVRMTEYRGRPLQQLSGGQRKRVAIAGALAVEPEVMIMDEPTAGLDPQSSMEVMELAEKLHLKGVTVMISTHDVDLAYSWCDTINVLRRGKDVYSGSSEGFYGDLENVYLCGLLRPSTFSMNREICRLSGLPESPYPKNVSQYLAKFRGGGRETGTLYCVPYAEGGDAAASLGEAVSAAGDGARVGIYGSDVRDAVSGGRLPVDFYFDGIDSCLTEAVMGRDSVLMYDAIYEPTVEEAAARLLGMGAEVRREVLR